MKSNTIFHMPYSYSNSCFGLFFAENAKNVISLCFAGVLFVAPWMAQAKDDRPSSPFSVNPSSSPAFTSMCMEGRNRWKSSRELASQSDGILALQFKLSREKSQPLSYRVCQICDPQMLDLVLMLPCAVLQ